MSMISSLKIANFRGFDNLEIDGLSRVNVLVGKNNVGKTSVLEAVFVAFATAIPRLPFAINSFRGFKSTGTPIELADQLKYLFHNLDIAVRPTIDITFTNKIKRNLRLAPKYRPISASDISIFMTPEQIMNGIELTSVITEKQPITYKSEIIFGNDGIIHQQLPDGYTEKASVTFIASTLKENQNTVQQLSSIIKKREEDVIVHTLKSFDDRIVGLKLLPDGIYFELEEVKELVSINVMGDGIKRFMNIITPLIDGHNSIICIDEIENGLHYSAHKLLWKSLLSFARQNNIQLFITTHSLETLESLSYVLEEEQDKTSLAIFNIDKTIKKGFMAYKYDAEGLAVLVENQIEFRR